MASRRSTETIPSVGREVGYAWAPTIEIFNGDPFVFILKADLRGIPPHTVRVQVKDRTLTIRGHRNDPAGRKEDYCPVEVTDSEGKVKVAMQLLQQYFERHFALPGSMDPSNAAAEYESQDSILTIRFPKTKEAPPDLATVEEQHREVWRQAVGIARGQRVRKPSVVNPFPIDFVVQGASTVGFPKPNDGIAMAAGGGTITRSGVRYVPLSYAAWASQVPRSTLFDWIKKDAKFAGKPIKTYISPITAEMYISEQSVHRMAERFIKWPSKHPAGFITLGETDDLSGFLGLPDAAKLLGVASRTMWVWARQGSTSAGKALDVVKCTASDHFYVRHKEIAELAGLATNVAVGRGHRTRKSVSSAVPHPS
jgi:HSP20 family molecular chaperone IbpA